jgi:thimet oligopeptidase
MSRLRVAALVAGVALTPAYASGPSAGATPHAGVRAAERTDSAPFYAGLGDPDSLKAAMDQRLAAAQEKIDRLAAGAGPRTVATTLRLYDDIRIDLDSVQAPSNLIGQAHPDERMREIADAANNRARAMAGDLVSNRAVYDALAAIDLSHADAQEKFYVQRELRDFRLNGVDRDAKTRERIGQLRRDLIAANQEYTRNVRADSRSITVASVAELAGLPPDFIARLKPDANGAVTLSTNLGTIIPVLTFARSDDVRKRLYIEWMNIAYPQNMAVLDRMLVARAELAHAIGFETFADLDMSDRMVGSVSAASAFIDRVAAASQPRATREYQEFPTQASGRARRDRGQRLGESHYTELVRRSSYDFDALSIRDISLRPRAPGRARRYQPAVRRDLPAGEDAPVWHPAVETYEVLDGDERVARIYFDMHPRPNKQNGTALASTVRAGVAGRRLPEIVVVASVPGGQPGDPSLLTHDDARNLFHEFGHALGAVFAGNGKWVGLTRTAERDFNEVSSQMLEEWMWDPATLATFARHYKTNEPIPAALVNRLRRASEFGKAIGPVGVRGQMVLARMSLSLHDRDPKDVDSTAMLRETTEKYMPSPFVEGTHRQTSMTHLANTNYASGYYMYMWSLVIAKDLFSRFDSKDLLAPGIAHEFREKVLRAGGTKPASAIVEDFLGRPFHANAWEAWLNRDPS